MQLQMTFLLYNTEVLLICNWQGTRVVLVYRHPRFKQFQIKKEGKDQESLQ